MKITIESIFMVGISSVLVVIGYFLRALHLDFKERFQRVEKRQDHTEKEIYTIRENYNNDMNQLKLNYISRFDDVKDSIYKIRDEIVTLINEMVQQVRDQKQFCEIIQQQKKEEKQ